MKMEKKWQRRVITLITVALLGLPAFRVGAEVTFDESSEPIGLYSTQVNLDLNRVAIYIETYPNVQYRDRLYQRIIKHLKGRGLLAASWNSNPVDPIAELRFILNVLPTDCPEKVLYFHRVELREEVTIKRVPFLEDVKAVTWFYGGGGYALVSPKSIEDLENDLDDLLYVFVLDHLNAGNPRKGPDLHLN